MSPDPTLHTHLSDPSLTPLLTSARDPQALASLTSLTSTSLTAHSTSLRLDMGTPRRLMVEYPDGVVLTSFIRPEEKKVAEGEDGEGDVNGTEREEARGGREGGVGTAGDMERQREGAGDEGADPPMLVGVVSASPGEGGEARRVAARLENVGRQFQREWAAEGQNSGEGQ